MNRLCYRIVFNHTRAMPMAVAETASSTGTGRHSAALGRAQRGTLPGAAVHRFAISTIGAIRLAVWIALGACMGLSTTATAQIVADPNAGANRPTVIATPNGLPQVNITRPSAAGVSTNHYNQFDVNRGGAILNNSPGIVNTQQAGLINGNPNLLPAAPRASSSTRSTACPQASCAAMWKWLARARRWSSRTRMASSWTARALSTRRARR
ncbi:MULTISPECIES: two-partner secretion domain-containing protein [unclassified Cupriavidus]|uniref:two-partner secretion domain-containing protein n=1 Tax=Cupriavidus sp. OTU4054 TaxID=3043853 RepID=UPI00313D3888